MTNVAAAYLKETKESKTLNTLECFYLQNDLTLFENFDSLLQKVMRRRVIKLGSNFAESFSTVQKCRIFTKNTHMHAPTCKLG